MAYFVGGSVQASDYNTTLLGGNPTTTSGRLNSVWGIGGATAGYGQPVLANVAAGGTIAASDWANLIARTSNAAAHQGTSITSVTAPVTGDTIVHSTAIPTNLQTIYTNRLNAGTVGSTTANSSTYNSTWGSTITTNVLSFAHTISFANGDAARYFFNSGGSLKITCSHANTTAGVNLMFNQLATAVGTIVISAPPNSTPITVAGVSYTGVTKLGGSGTPSVLATTRGYYGLTNANTILFSQPASSGPSGYLSSTIGITAKTNGTQGTNSDNGNVINIYTVWQESPAGLLVGAGATVTLTVQYPESTYIANTWGTATITSSNGLL